MRLGRLRSGKINVYFLIGVFDRRFGVYLVDLLVWGVLWVVW